LEQEEEEEEEQNGPIEITDDVDQAAKAL